MFSQQQQQSQLGGATSGGGLFSQQQKLGGGLFNTPGQTKLGGLNTGLVGTTGGGLFSQQQTSQPGGLFNQPSGGLFNQSSTGVGGLGALGQQQTQVCVSIIMCVLFSTSYCHFTARRRWSIVSYSTQSDGGTWWWPWRIVRGDINIGRGSGRPANITG